MKDRRLKINEIFFSIQGESTHAGRPCQFVRLSGCPLRCTYCDTEYAFYKGEQKTFEEILTALKKNNCSLVEVTGGEPLAQPLCRDFLKLLADEGYEVLLETSGAFSLEGLDPRVKIIMDVKTPSSGELSKMYWDNMGFLKNSIDEIKFVIADRYDFDFAEKICAQFNLLSKNTVLMSASFNKLPMKTLADWILNSQKPYRMQTQLHKHIWGADVQGV